MTTADDRFQMLNSTLGANLSLAREAAGLTQTELADRAGTSRATIAQIESGSGDPRLSTLHGVCDALGISPLVLLMRPSELANLQQIATATPGMVDAWSRTEESRRLARLAGSANFSDRRRAARESGAAIGEFMKSPPAVVAGLTSADVTQRVTSTPAAAIGAAVGAALLPGPGAILGAFLAGALSRNKDE